MVIVTSQAAALLLLLVFDVFRAPRAPSLGMILFGYRLYLPLIVLLWFTLLGVSMAFRRSGAWPRVTRSAAQAALGAGFLAGIAIGVGILESIVYDPIKFSYLSYRVESASTPIQEREAFRLAEKYGRVWEVNRISQREHSPERARNLSGDSLLELEWLETWPSGTPFRAYRRVLDERNLEVFYKSKRSSLERTR